MIRDTEFVSSTKLDLVRSLYAAFGRGDYDSSDWAHPEIEFVSVDGPTPGSWKGPEGMTEGWRDFLSAWDDLRIEVDEYREVDDERVLAFVHLSGRGKRSGLELERMHANAAALWQIRDSKVRRCAYYWDRERALAELGLPSESGSPRF